MDHQVDQPGSKDDLEQESASEDIFGKDVGLHFEIHAKHTVTETAGNRSGLCEADISHDILERITREDQHYLGKVAKGTKDLVDKSICPAGIVFFIFYFFFI